MHGRHRITLLLISILLLPHSSLITAQEIYRWQDGEGKHHYGDRVPDTAVNTRAIALTLQSPLYLVERVIDGDTIVVQHAGKVRLLGINAPEIAHHDRNAEPYGEKARQRMQQLLNGKRVYLSFDQQRRDRFDRLLAHVTLEDGTRINELLLHEGLARALFLQPNMRLLQHYYHIEAEALQAERGIWSLAEYHVRSAQRADECIKRFCRLQGRVSLVERKRFYTYLQLPGQLQVAIHHEHLPHFHEAGIDVEQLQGHHITIRGWVGSREGEPKLQLQHPLQIRLTPQ